MIGFWYEGWESEDVSCKFGDFGALMLFDRLSCVWSGIQGNQHMIATAISAGVGNDCALIGWYLELCSYC